jgi:TolA-binding protein
VTRAAWLIALVCASCGSPAPAAYTKENAAALGAQRRGEHAVAARHYELAAESAKNERDADESRYRAAQSYVRAGDTARAEALLSGLARDTDAERGARAAFALAELWERAGDTERASQQRVAAIRKHPASGLSRKALEEQVRFLRAQAGSPAALAYLRGEAATLSRTELAEAVAYRTARELDEAGENAAARDAYLSCAARFPYPAGAYWDDALFRAAQKELELREPARAVDHLQRLLKEQESANFTGSYERARYAEAQLELGRIYRDVLQDPARAKRELRKVWQNHPNSTLADDALFQEAVLARQTGDTAGACAAVVLLTRELPESRFAACAHLLCDSAAQTPQPCHDYIIRAAGLR